MFAGLFYPWLADGYSVPVSHCGFSPVKNILLSLCVQFSSQLKCLLLRKILPEHPVWSNHSYFLYHLLNSRLYMAFPIYTCVSVYLLIIWLLLLPTCTPSPPSHKTISLMRPQTLPCSPWYLCCLKTQTDAPTMYLLTLESAAGAWPSWCLSIVKAEGKNQSPLSQRNDNGSQIP